MKKLLAILIVLAVTSLASAVVMTAAYNSQTSTISVSVIADPEMCNIALAVTDGGGTLSNFAAGAQAPADSAFAYSMGSGMDFEGYGEGEVWAMVHLTTGTQIYVTGEWLTAHFTLAEGRTSAVVKLYEFTEENGGTFYEIIPEPATMALLGLGGLMLRRRK